MRPPAALIKAVQDEHLSCEARGLAVRELDTVDEDEVADAILAIASMPDLPPEVATAAGVTLGKVFFRLGRHQDNFAFRDLSGEAYLAFDDTVAQMLLQNG